MVLEKALESPLDCKEIQPVHSEGDQPWVFFGRNDAEAETPVLWPPHTKSWLIGKDSDAGRDWGQEEKGTTEDEMAGWHHWLDGPWVWVNSGSWWWTGRPGVLRFMGSKRVGHDWATELNWTECISKNWSSDYFPSVAVVIYTALPSTGRNFSYRWGGFTRNFWGQGQLWFSMIMMMTGTKNYVLIMFWEVTYIF